MPQVGADASPPELVTTNIFAFGAASQATSSATRAASAAPAWLAPEGSSSEVSSAAPATRSRAIVPTHPRGASSAASSAGPAHVEWVWQVQTGKSKKRKWSQVSDDLAVILENAYSNGATGCSWNWDGWVYQYDLASMTQCSVSKAGTERPIRRIPYNEAYAEG